MSRSVVGCCSYVARTSLVGDDEVAHWRNSPRKQELGLAAAVGGDGVEVEADLVLRSCCRRSGCCRASRQMETARPSCRGSPGYASARASSMTQISAPIPIARRVPSGDNARQPVVVRDIRATPSGSCLPSGRPRRSCARVASSLSIRARVPSRDNAIVGGAQIPSSSPAHEGGRGWLAASRRTGSKARRHQRAGLVVDEMSARAVPRGRAALDERLAFVGHERADVDTRPIEAAGPRGEHARRGRRAGCRAIDARTRPASASGVVRTLRRRRRRQARDRGSTAANTIVSSGPQDAPYNRPLLGILQIVENDPPLERHAAKLGLERDDQNPMDLLSNEKNGWRAPSGAGDRPSVELIDATQVRAETCRARPCKRRYSPSGETAIGVPVGSE